MPAREREKAARRQETTPAPEERFREEMSAWEGVFRQAFRLPSAHPDDLIGRLGWDVYDRMMTDAQVRSSINTKRFAVLARPWEIFPAIRERGHPGFSAASEARDFVEDALRGLRGPDGSSRAFRATLFEMMSAFFRGFSLGEIIWRYEERGRWRGRIVLDAIKFKNPRQIGFEMDEFLNIRSVLSRGADGRTIEVPLSKCLLFVHGARDEMPYGDSDLRPVYKHWFSKQKILEFFNLRLQRYGIPFAYASISSASESVRWSIQQILRDFQQDSSAVFPASVKPQLLETRGDGAEPFLAALEWHNQQIAIGVLLQTLTSGEGLRSGSMALGRVHFDILLFALDCMKQDVEDAVNAQIVRPLVDANFVHGHYPRFSLGNVNEKDVVQLAQAFDVLLRHEVVGPKEPVVRELFNLPALD